MAFAVGKSLDISIKQAVEICSHLRGRKTARAKKILNDVINLKEAIPMRRFHRDTAHKKGIGPGKYPRNASKAILAIIESAESNAKNKGMSTDLTIVHMCAHKAPSAWHYGRKRRRKMIRSHVEVVLAESKKDVKND